MEEEVKLLGAWPSPFSYRVIWALKLKGVRFEYLEENLSDKSQLLLQYNPVKKMIPVLVHRGKPVLESTVILEYIDQIWPQSPLLPADPRQRAMERLWTKFGEENDHTFFAFFQKAGEEQKKAAAEARELLRTLEERGLGRKKFFGGEKIGMTDLAFGWMAVWLPVMEEAVGIKLLESHLFPSLHAWTERFKEVHVIKENLPDKQEMLAYFGQKREMFITAVAESNQDL